MSNMSGKLGLITGMYIAAAMDSNIFLVDDESKCYSGKNIKPKINPELKDQDFTGKGMKKFHYGCKFVWAINQKNADKKAAKLGYSINPLKTK